MSTPCKLIYIWFQIQRHDSLSTLSGKPGDWSSRDGHATCCHERELWFWWLILTVLMNSTQLMWNNACCQRIWIDQAPWICDWYSTNHTYVFHDQCITLGWGWKLLKASRRLLQTTHKWCDLGRPCTVHVSLSDRRCLALGTGLWYDPQDACPLREASEQQCDITACQLLICSTVNKDMCQTIVFWLIFTGSPILLLNFCPNQSWTNAHAYSISKCTWEHDERKYMNRCTCILNQQMYMRTSTWG